MLWSSAWFFIFIFLSLHLFLCFFLKCCLIYAHLVNRNSCTKKCADVRNMPHCALVQNAKSKVCNVLPHALERVLKCDELECNHSGKEAPDLFPLSPPNLQFWGRERHLKPSLISPSHTSLLPTPAKLAWKNKTGPGTENLTTFDDLNAGALLVKKRQSLENGRLSFPPTRLHTLHMMSP